MNIGIFSGSFNPIHTGHLILANYIVEFSDIDEIWFLVSPCSPFKEGREDLIDESDRHEMVRLTVEEYPKFKASNFEFNLPRPSYTINTLDALRDAYPEHDFTLIIGSDNWMDFEKWRKYDQIIDNYSLKIYPRLDYRISIPVRFKNKVEALDAPIIEISSTFIRESIAANKDMKTFVPLEAYQYILDNNLYK